MLVAEKKACSVKVQVNHAFKDDPFIRKFKLAFTFKFSFNVSLSLTEDELLEHFQDVAFDAASATRAKYRSQCPEENSLYCITYLGYETLGWILNSAIVFASGNRTPKPLNINMIFARNSSFSSAMQKEIPINDMITPCRMSIAIEDMVVMSIRAACNSGHEVGAWGKRVTLHDFDCDNQINNTCISGFTFTILHLIKPICERFECCIMDVAKDMRLGNDMDYSNFNVRRNGLSNIIRTNMIEKRAGTKGFGRNFTLYSYPENKKQQTKNDDVAHDDEDEDEDDDDDDSTDSDIDSWYESKRKQNRSGGIIADSIQWTEFDSNFCDYCNLYCNICHKMDGNSGLVDCVDDMIEVFGAGCVHDYIKTGDQPCKHHHYQCGKYYFEKTIKRLKFTTTTICR